MAATAKTLVGGNGRVSGNTFTGAAAPTVDNDASDGINAGDLWIDTVAHKLYFCEANTEGAAVWTAAN